MRCAAVSFFSFRARGPEPPRLAHEQQVHLPLRGHLRLRRGLLGGRRLGGRLLHGGVPFTLERRQASLQWGRRAGPLRHQLRAQQLDLLAVVLG